MDSATQEVVGSFELPWPTPPGELVALERERISRLGQALSKFRQLAGDDLNDRVMRARRLDGVRELREKLDAVDPDTLLSRSRTDRKVVISMLDLLLDESWSAGLNGAQIKRMLNKLLPLGTTDVNDFMNLPKPDTELRRMIFGIESITLADCDTSLLEAAFLKEASAEDLEKAQPLLETMKAARAPSARERELADAWQTR